MKKIKILLAGFSVIVFYIGVVATSFSLELEKESYSSEKQSRQEVLLNQKISYYRDLYPDITFMVLKGGADALNDMISLDIVLGYEPSSMDYEHLPESRSDLIFVSVWRIMRMLQARLPSASLFRVDDPLGWQKQVCVLTINSKEIAADSIRATGYLLDFPYEVLQNIPKHMRLIPTDYLAFVIDHELSHCLKSMYVGPQKMSDKALWAEYNSYLDEKVGDIYALAMHIKMSGNNSGFTKNIKRIRCMSLYSADPDHLTVGAMAVVEKIPVYKLKEMSSKDIFQMANNYMDSLNIDYDNYIQYLASSVQAMNDIGVDSSLVQVLSDKVKGIHADPVKVKELVAKSQRCFSELTGTSLKN